MTFAQALARIEELNGILIEKDDGSRYYAERFLERNKLLLKHADSIVQLAKAAAEMRDAYQRNVTGTPVQINQRADSAAEAYDCLMKVGVRG